VICSRQIQAFPGLVSSGPAVLPFIGHAPSGGQITTLTPGTLPTAPAINGRIAPAQSPIAAPQRRDSDRCDLVIADDLPQISQAGPDIAELQPTAPVPVGRKADDQARPARQTGPGHGHLAQLNLTALTRRSQARKLPG
jgi:hypothetical protein